MSEILKQGKEAEVLLANPIINKAIKDMRENLTHQEDVIMGDLSLPREERLNKIERVATFRLLLADFQNELENYVQAAENAEVLKNI